MGLLPAAHHEVLRASVVVGEPLGELPRLVVDPAAAGEVAGEERHVGQAVQRRHPDPVIALLPGDVGRGVQVGGTDPERRDAILEDLEFNLLGLHHHHGGEDSHLWPKLTERVPEERATIQRMEAAHHEIDGLVDRVRQCATDWSTARPGPASAAAATALGNALAEFRLVLADHLAEEERLVVPLLAQHVTRREWTTSAR
ncbi:hemerythrin domain-containing protein [Ammonicoccus fulvus]|uniref:hemerythrin domain-containing protein n=1 Tax=Ammonicoccus fulvus TaxID=3138240 RepID=UPI003CC7EA0E